jgi:hypothetical protein
MKQRRSGLSDYVSRNAQARERFLTEGSRLLSRTTKPLWYLETLVLSARFFQRLSGPEYRAGGAKRFPTREELWRDGLLPILTGSAQPVRGLEFGVASGKATAWWHDNLGGLAGWDGFDTFEGLPEPWTRGGVTVMEQGVFAPAHGEPEFPVIQSTTPIQWHKGLIGDTISDLSRDPGERLLILVDVDLLEPTRDILNWVLANGRPGDVIYFDEAFDPFNEGLALQEAMDAGLRFRTMGFTGSALAVVLEG